MCIETKEKLEINIAEKDIKVIKILSYCDKVSKFLFFKRKKIVQCVSPYLNKRYKLGKLYKDDIKYSYLDDLKVYRTSKGLYSFANENSITTNFAFYPLPLHYKRGIFRAIIPNGSKYYTNGKGEFCSDSLKILSYIKDLNLVIDYKTGKINW